MTYAEVLTCEKAEVAGIYARASRMLADMTDAAKCRREFAGVPLSHEQMSWNLYRLHRGFDFYGTERSRRLSGRDKALGVRLEFSSLEELSLILTARGTEVMTYAQLYTADEGYVSELHERSNRMLIHEFDPLVKWSWRNAPHDQKAWDLSRMCGIGLRRRCESELLGFFRLEFSSLEELDVKLAAMGY